MYSQLQKHFLLKLARRAIVLYLDKNKILKLNDNEIEEDLKQDRGVFVTLTLNGKLRGCIGHIQAVQPLYKDVIENAVNAAFEDPRFNPLTKEELKRINIEISALSIPQKLEYESVDDLLAKITPKQDGVIIKKDGYAATYLPQVWEDLPTKEMFISSLSEKAGLDSDAWKKGDLAVEIYQVEKIETQTKHSN